MLLPRFAFAIVALAGSPVLARREQPFTVDDMLRIEHLSEPVFAPNSEHIAYVVTGPGDGDARQSDLWTVSWQGGDARPVHATLERDEWAPAWSADGRVLAFLRSGGDGESVQLWMSEAGAPARKVTGLAGGVEAFTLAPDGDSAVVVSEMGENVGSTAKVPPPIVIDRFTVRQDGRGWLDDRRKQLFWVELASGEAVQITEGGFDHQMPAFSPDGRWIAFVSSRCEQADAHYCSDVYVVAPEGGEPRRISSFEGGDADPAFGAGGPRWSPDSRSLAWVRAGDERLTWYTPFQLVTADLATGTEQQVAWIDRWFYQPHWSADGRHLLALVEQDRDTWLARIDSASGRIDYLTSGSRFAYDFAVAPNGRIAVLGGDADTPTQLRTVEPAPRVLSPQNAWVAQRRLAETRDIVFTSDGVEIHGMLLLPLGHEEGQRHPLIVRLHGGPVYQFSHEFMADWQVYAANGYAVLGINPRGSSGRGAAFAQAQMARWGAVDVADVMAGIDHVLAMGIADPGAIGAGGGAMAAFSPITSSPAIRASRRR